jgi:hypothetical protein
MFVPEIEKLCEVEAVLEQVLKPDNVEIDFEITGNSQDPLYVAVRFNPAVTVAPSEVNCTVIVSPGKPVTVVIVPDPLYEAINVPPVPLPE